MTRRPNSTVKGKIRVRKRNGQIVYVTPKVPSDLLHWQAPDKFFDDPLPELPKPKAKKDAE